MVLLFEDNENTPSSKLLKKSMYGNNIMFSGSNSLLSREAEKLKSKGNNVIIFIDLAINNHRTKQLYEDLSDKYEDDEHVLVLPIICIEYYILKMLCSHGFLEFKVFQTEEIQSLLQSFVVDITGESIDKSLEKQYKHILSEIGNKKHCYINKTPNNTLRGQFYSCGCPCNKSYCTDYRDASIDYKAESLYSTLPVFFVDEAYRKHFKSLGLNLDIQGTTLKDAFNELVRLYTKLQKFYGEGSIPIFRFNYNFKL